MKRTTIILCGVVQALSAIAATPSRTLLNAIAFVESTNGRASCNVYQIRPEYVAEVNRIQRKLTRIDGVKRRRYSCGDVFSVPASEEMMSIYWVYYSNRMEKAGDEEFAKLHNVGFRGMKTRRKEAERYWHRVKKAMDK